LHAEDSLPEDFFGFSASKQQSIDSDVWWREFPRQLKSLLLVEFEDMSVQYKKVPAEVPANLTRGE
jgi:hypothetical protein